MTLQCRAVFVFVLAFCFLPSILCATGASTFHWHFANTTVSSLQQCKEYTVVIDDVEGEINTPPYYMVAWKSNGIPSVTEIGSNSSNLTWQANQASGSAVLLVVVDSEGNSGGNFASILTVSSSDDASCLPNAPTESITLTSNVTGSLDACEPLGLTTSGGTKPYTVSIAVVGADVVTNFTLGPDDDTMTYINRAGPSSQMFVSVSDANGVWGASPKYVTTSSDSGALSTNCNELVSSSSNSADNIDEQSNNTQAKNMDDSSGSHKTVIIATVVPIVVVVLLILTLYLWRRYRILQKEKITSEMAPVAWRETPNNRVGGQVKHAASLPSRSIDSPSSRSLNPKIREVPIIDIAASTALGYYTGPLSSSPSSNSIIKTPNDVDIIIQHRDAGSAPAVREVPPPYTTDLTANHSS
ncbi:hypothetical protein PNOK_0444900 [Pyrrhoderma noxium]|uniref:Uncharacterized protein n=1 Tax=Pyrrhoderma noxium TaxID=2282107 RepID=A0A286UJ59_9AGAM|nr:hypothetical protein PNOK_0444900 [Pyrrhoderma noxium]